MNSKGALIKLFVIAIFSGCALDDPSITNNNHPKDNRSNSTQGGDLQPKSDISFAPDSVGIFFRSESRCEFGEEYFFSVFMRETIKTGKPERHELNIGFSGVRLKIANGFKIDLTRHLISDLGPIDSEVPQGDFPRIPLNIVRSENRERRIFLELLRFQGDASCRIFPEYNPDSGNPPPPRAKAECSSTCHILYPEIVLGQISIRKVPTLSDRNTTVDYLVKFADGKILSGTVSGLGKYTACSHPVPL